MKTFRKLIAALFVTAAAFASTAAHAVTECNSTVGIVWAGDAGHITVFLSIGTVFTITPTDPNIKNIMSSAQLALLLGKPVTVRFSANGVSCTNNTNRTDVVGMYIFA